MRVLLPGRDVPLHTLSASALYLFTINLLLSYSFSQGINHLDIQETEIQHDSFLSSTLPQKPFFEERLVPQSPQFAQVAASHSNDSSLPLLLSAISDMQSNFFALWQGTWPRAIDWTAAVLGTHLSSTLRVLTRSPAYSPTSAPVNENLLNKYFAHLTAFYYGENAFSLRTQAYDDMLWVVLDWLSAVNFVKEHSELHYAKPNHASQHDVQAFYGKEFIPSFAHRARIFYDIASQGWDESLCGGGMVWNPRLTPYKNAITNQLFIAASINMYLYFPGDNNTSPFISTSSSNAADDENVTLKTLNEVIPPAKAHDGKYLKYAVDGYKWLAASNMTNKQGLYVDGFHIRGWRPGDGRNGHNGSIGSGKCDVRDEQVYTYNQGVLLSGLRGLWSATGARSYLDDGYVLIDNVIKATGWRESMVNETSLLDDGVYEFDDTYDDDDDRRERLRWHGIGRNGVLEETCDAGGYCSQNGHTFKGIFFHHLRIFCEPLPMSTLDECKVSWAADPDLAAEHAGKCRSYEPWIRRNAIAACGTRDNRGVFGMWWGPGLWRRNRRTAELMRDVGKSESHDGTDYRNKGVPDDTIWRLPDPSGAGIIPMNLRCEDPKLDSGLMLDGFRIQWDPNLRGRGRTVETQSGGLAVLRALYGYGIDYR
ncbi:hypothetical protein MMC25_003133 [Agyrium rufum]|nr:hypothetical protein [Agyrium rufum]